MRKTFVVASRSGSEVTPLHLLEAAAEFDDGPVGAALAVLRPPASQSGLRGGGARAGWLFLQTQSAARAFAASRGEAMTSAHLVVAALDQHDPQTTAALVAADVDAAQVRRTALATLGVPADLPQLDLPAPTPAGTMGRPPLPEAELDPQAWAVLRWRQAHLPLRQVRRAAHADALRSLESRAAWQVADRFGVDDDQRYSLRYHHEAAVERSVPTGEATHEPQPGPSSGWRPGRRRFVPRFLIGWPTWFGNRRVGLRDAWFRLRTASAYRGQP